MRQTKCLQELKDAGDSSWHWALIMELSSATLPFPEALVKTFQFAIFSSFDSIKHIKVLAKLGKWCGLKLSVSQL